MNEFYKKKMVLIKKLSLLGSMGILLTFVGCGQTGPLYLPAPKVQKKQATQNAAASPLYSKRLKTNDS